MAGGKGGISWIEITSVVNNPQLSPLAAEFLDYVQDPEMAHTVAFAEGTFNPVAQMGNPDCFKLFTKEELDASSGTAWRRRWRARSNTTSCPTTTSCSTS